MKPGKIRRGWIRQNIQCSHCVAKLSVVVKGRLNGKAGWKCQHCENVTWFIISKDNEP